MIRNSPSDADHGRVPDPVTERPRPSTGPPQKFQWGWLSRLFGVSQPTPVVSPLPVLLVGVVFGLAMDYQVFLVTSMREEHSHGAPPVRAVVPGSPRAPGVVTAAVIIMISVFAGFILSSRPSPNPLISPWPPPCSSTPSSSG